MTTNNQPVLYTKQGCPWCQQARDVLEQHGVSYHERVVSHDRDAFAEMQRISGQTFAPVLDWHGDVLSDFGAEELHPFLDTKLAATIA